MSNSWLSILGGGKSGTLYFDGSHNNQANKAGAGCIIVDNQGVFVVAAAYNITENFPDYCNVAIAEAVALRNGLKLAKDYNVSLSHIKGDNREVINHVLNRNRRRSKSKQLLSGIIQEIVGMITPKIELIKRDANKVADKLASLGSNSLHRGGHRIFPTFSDLPPQVAELVRQETVGEGKGSSMVGNIVKVGAVVAGVAMCAMGFSKLFSESTSSSYQNDLNNRAFGMWEWEYED